MHSSLVGQRFTHLTVLAEAGRYFGNVRYLCDCDCGKQKLVPANKLRNGNTKSCGCYKAAKARTKIGPPRHGHARRTGKSGAYQSWDAMIQRCTNPNHRAFKNYGGRGIKICERWFVFDNFLADMGERPPGMTIEREDNDGNYEKSNCKWATRDEQNKNSRHCRHVRLGLAASNK